MSCEHLILAVAWVLWTPLLLISIYSGRGEIKKLFRAYVETTFPWIVDRTDPPPIVKRLLLAVAIAVLLLHTLAGMLTTHQLAVFSPLLLLWVLGLRALICMWLNPYMEFKPYFNETIHVIIVSGLLAWVFLLVPSGSPLTPLSTLFLFYVLPVLFLFRIVMLSIKVAVFLVGRLRLAGLLLIALDSLYPVFFIPAGSSHVLSVAREFIFDMLCHLQ